MSVTSLNPGPVFKDTGLNSRHTPGDLSENQSDLQAKRARDTASTEPPGPVAEVYDVHNTSTKLVLLNNTIRPKSSSHLRGYSNKAARTSPNPDRHNPDKTCHKNEERHMSCKISSPPNTATGQRKKDGEKNKTDSQNDKPKNEYTKKYHLPGPPRCEVPYHRRKLPISMSDNRYLTDSSLTKGNRLYLSQIARVYDTTDMQRKKLVQYRDILMRQQGLGWHSFNDYTKYMHHIYKPKHHLYTSTSPRPKSQQSRRSRKDSDNTESKASHSSRSSSCSERSKSAPPSKKKEKQKTHQSEKVSEKRKKDLSDGKTKSKNENETPNKKESSYGKTKSKNENETQKKKESSEEIMSESDQPGQKREQNFDDESSSPQTKDSEPKNSLSLLELVTASNSDDECIHDSSSEQTDLKEVENEQESNKQGHNNGEAIKSHQNSTKESSYQSEDEDVSDDESSITQQEKTHEQEVIQHDMVNSKDNTMGKSASPDSSLETTRSRSSSLSSDDSKNKRTTAPQHSHQGTPDPETSGQNQNVKSPKGSSQSIMNLSDDEKSQTQDNDDHSHQESNYVARKSDDDIIESKRETDIEGQYSNYAGDNTQSTDTTYTLDNSKEDETSKTVQHDHNTQIHEHTKGIEVTEVMPGGQVNSELDPNEDNCRDLDNGSDSSGSWSPTMLTATEGTTRPKSRLGNRPKPDEKDTLEYTSNKNSTVEDSNDSEEDNKEDWENGNIDNDDTSHPEPVSKMDMDQAILRNDKSAPQLEESDKTLIQIDQNGKTSENSEEPATEPVEIDGKLGTPSQTMLNTEESSNVHNKIDKSEIIPGRMSDEISSGDEGDTEESADEEVIDNVNIIGEQPREIRTSNLDMSAVLGTTEDATDDKSLSDSNHSNSDQEQSDRDIIGTPESSTADASKFNLAKDKPMAEEEELQDKRNAENNKYYEENFGRMRFKQQSTTFVKVEDSEGKNSGNLSKSEDNISISSSERSTPSPPSQLRNTGLLI